MNRYTHVIGGGTIVPVRAWWYNERTVQCRVLYKRLDSDGVLSLEVQPVAGNPHQRGIRSERLIGSWAVQAKDEDEDLEEDDEEEDS